MGEIIGIIGGLLMVILVVILLYNFLLDSNLIKKKKLSTELKYVLLTIIGLYIIQLLVCGIIHSLYDDNTLHINNTIVWKNTIVFNNLFNINNNYGLNIILNGNTPVYYYLIRLIGSILFNAYDDISFYIGFLCGFSSYVILYYIAHDYFKNKDLISLLFLIPGSIFMFIPTPFTLEITLILLFIYCLLKRKNNILLLILAILCLLFHVMGIAAIIIYILYHILGKKFNNYLTLLVISSVSMGLLIFGLIYHWNNWYELVPVLSIGLVFYYANKLTNNIINYLKILFIISNAYIILAILNNIF